MTDDAKRGMDPFDGDRYAFATVCALMARYGCTDFVETGTYRGGTTLGMSRMFPNRGIWTVDADPGLYAQAKARFGTAKINQFLGSSPIVLREKILPHVGDSPLFYLDAHASAYAVSKGYCKEEYYPLREEIAEIAVIWRRQIIIVIHDVRNPHHPNYSYDTDHGVPLDWEYLRDSLIRVYGDQVPHFYNDAADGETPTGILYVGVVRP